LVTDMHYRSEGAKGTTPNRRGVGSSSPGDRRGSPSRLRWLLLLLTGVIAFAGLLLKAGSGEAPGLRTALETAATLVALAAAWGQRARFLESRRARDLALCAALTSTGLVSLFAELVPATLALRGHDHAVSVQLCGGLLVAALFAAAAMLRADRVEFGLTPGRASAVALTAGVAAVAVGELAAHLVATVRPLSIALGVASAILFVAAGVALTRRHQDASAPIISAAATLLAALAAAGIATGPIAPDRVDASTTIRLLAFVLLYGAVMRQQSDARARSVRAAALLERRRVAGDLHDGLAQDLAFIAAHGPSLADQIGYEHPVTIAALRALTISRGTISDLTAWQDASSEDALAALAHELHERFAIHVAVDVDLDRDLECEAREDVSRIAREAIVNAARHGKASNVALSLRRAGTGVVLRVVDDGTGICPTGARPAGDGFGLRSMRDRAAARGGRLSLRSPRRGGTELEVVLP
jgi:signal transduction histidine kinase